MAKLGIPTLGWLTSILLTLVTLFIFGNLQNHGPDSALKQFHLAASEHNRIDASGLVTPNFDSAPTQELWIYITGLMANRRTVYEITHVTRQANAAAIVVRYRLPKGANRALIWKLIRTDGNWRVDTRETALAARYLLGRQIP